ncbi:MAG: alkaline phosphatase [Pseudomonadota bacterium]
MPVRRLLLATALSAVIATPAAAQDGAARNVILMISDGIGFNGWLASDYYQGKLKAQSYQTARPDGTTPVVYGLQHDSLNLIDATGAVLPNASDVAGAAGAIAQGYDPQTRWSRFEAAFRNDYPPVSERYTSYTDSAAAGTTMHTGRKTANGRLNMDWSGEVRFQTIAEIAMERGRSAGAVTTVQISHATPASTIAHNISRQNYAEIFNEMAASDLSVIMGAGHPLYDDSGNEVEPTAYDAEDGDDPFRFLGGADTLAALTSEAGLNGFSFVDAPTDFEAMANGEMVPERVIGVARARNTLQASREELADADTPSGMAFNPAVPDLETMSLGALNVLNRDPDGFFLMVEGGAVDWMGHANNMPRFIEEQIDFDRAVDSVIAWVEANSSWDETLLIVTSDHETGGIWGEGTYTNGDGGPVAADRSGEALVAARFDPAEDFFNEFLAVQDRGAGNMPGYQFASRNHTNELVPLWAMGPGAEMFAEFTRTDQMAAKLWGEQYDWDGSYIDNTAVFHVMNGVLSPNFPMQ